jgi:hypothetical protein
MQASNMHGRGKQKQYVQKIVDYYNSQKEQKDSSVRVSHNKKGPTCIKGTPRIKHSSKQHRQRPLQCQRRQHQENRLQDCIREQSNSQTNPIVTI